MDKNDCPHLLTAVPLALAVIGFAAFAASPALAQSEAPRPDAHHSCPGYGEEIRERFARALPYIARNGETRVSFELRGRKITGVQTQGGPLEYRHLLRRAVYGIECVGDGPSSQRYTFLVVFKAGGADGAAPLALVDGLTVASLD
ncbi:MAG TPA: hypothetical protein VJN44_03050 [Roseateles sp.]|nr:hypothetical protein [Roseateles sp.]